MDKNDDFDPEIEDLLNDAASSNSADMSDYFGDGVGDDFFDSEGKDINDLGKEEVTVSAVDLSVKAFAPITKFYSDTPHEYFNDSTYYKVALGGEGEISQRMHKTLSKFLTCQDPKDRTVFRQQMGPIYWEYIKGIAQKAGDEELPKPKKYAMRYGLVLPSLFSAEQKELFAKVIDTNETGEPVYYLDEWFHDICLGALSLSATDEARPTKKLSGSEEVQRLGQMESKMTGKLQNCESLLSSKENQRNMIELELKARVDTLCQHEMLRGMGVHKAPYTEGQKKIFTDISDKLKQLFKIDKEISGYISEYQNSKDQLESIQGKKRSMVVSSTASSDEVLTEVDTVRQMCKMTVGRQGNHFPIFTREYFHCMPKGTGFRENVISILAWIESIDPECFCRTHKNTLNRIVPYVLLVPTYGDRGFCWEPFDRYNRVTSRGRIIVPMYPKNLQIAILTAVADLRWQVAKEKASYYWMEEGLTGQYYQWFADQKLKGDLKDYFIEDYVLWMTKESEGMQKLPKEVRGIFWRNMPFAQEVKDKLKTRSITYQELCQKDMNRAMSDGY